MYRVLHQHEHKFSGRINMTPMIDVTFLLLTFFMLASHFASAEKIDVNLPQPNNNQAVDRRLKEKIIINMLYNDEHAEPSLTVGPLPVTDKADLAAKLSEFGKQSPPPEVILRADRRLNYGDVREVMEIIAGQKLTRLQIVTEFEK